MTQTNRPLQDPVIFAQLFEQHHLAVFRFIYGLSGGPLPEVEDLTAETFLRAWKARRRFEGEQHAAIGWLLTIARHLVIDAARRRKSHHGEQLFSELDDYQQLIPMELSDSTEKQVLHQEQVGLLLRQLSSLPTDRRELLVLRYILGWQVKEIAAHMGMLENTVSVYLRRSIEQIRAHWPGENL
jgi:RNA polymerase sigma-70 factor (ECF subfamily)